MAEIVARMIARSLGGGEGEAEAKAKADHGRRFSFAVGRYVLGRDDADVVLTHPDVSRRHAELEVRSDGATIRDLGSKNGVRIDGVAITRAELGDGAELRFGELRLVFEFFGSRIDTVLRRSGEPTVRRARVEAPALAAAQPAASPTSPASPLLPFVAAGVFALLLIALLWLG